jgi:hypothetical protein
MQPDAFKSGYPQSRFAFLPGAAQPCTPELHARAFLQICEAVYWPHALPGSPAGKKQAQPQIQLHKLPRIAERLSPKRRWQPELLSESTRICLAYRWHFDVTEVLRHVTPRELV